MNGHVCLLDLVDGNNQGAAVDKITYKIPIVKLAEVEEEIKKNYVKKTNLQGFSTNLFL